MPKSLSFQQPSILILCILLSHALGSTSLQCLSLRRESLDIIDARQMLNTQQNVLSCMVLSIGKGRLSQTRAILDLYSDQYRQKMVGVLQRQLNRLELIDQEVVQGESNCVPVIKWGQNITHLFISMKMSHRWDSPPCLRTQLEQSSLSVQRFQYINLCIVSHQKIKYNMSIDFYYQVKEDPVTVIKDGVGTYSTQIEKGEGKVWPFLGKNQVLYPIWEEIAQRYNPIHKQYNQLLDGVLREKRSKPSKLKNKPKNQQQKLKQSNETIVLPENGQEIKVEDEHQEKTQGFMDGLDEQILDKLKADSLQNTIQSQEQQSQQKLTV